MDPRLLLDESSLGVLARHASGDVRRTGAPTATAPTTSASTPPPVGGPRPPTPAPVERLPPTDAFYLTTAINYTNGPPHFGHAYEAVCADVIARYHRLAGRRVFFLTGTDEHGQKVEQAALAAGRSPQEHCDAYAAVFKRLDHELMVSFDRFIRTTEPDHKESAREIWRRVQARKTRGGEDNIYLGNYSGWYNRYDEQFITRAEVEQLPKNELGEPLDTLGRPLDKKEEPAFFFRMSAYKQPLLDHLAENPFFVQPAFARAEVEAFLRQDLEDLCISRTTIAWGVPCPVPEPGHVMYVWFDALTNYLSGVGTLLPGRDTGLWPADVHVIGKDIVRFHAVYWPCMLMAAGLALPKCVFAHGFVTAEDGQKMGKSLGNARDPFEQLALYGVDALRYYMVRQSTFGMDLPYSETVLVSMHNDILLKSLGNLVQRAVKTCQLFCDGRVPPESAAAFKGRHPFDLVALQRAFERCFAVVPAAAGSGGGGGAAAAAALEHEHGLQLRAALVEFERAVSDTNAYVDGTAPWLLKGDEHARVRREMVRGALEAVFALLHFASPFIPKTVAGAIGVFGARAHFEPLLSLRGDFSNLEPGTPVSALQEAVFNELEVGSGIKRRGDAESIVRDREQQRERARQEVERRREEKRAAKEAPKESPVAAMHMCVGRVVDARVGAGDLFVEKVDVGRGEPIDVVSGLGAYCEPADLRGRLVVVVMNLEPFKPRQLPDLVSVGMLLAVKDAEAGKLELLAPPAAAQPGQVVALRGSSGAPPADVAKPRAWDKAKKALAVDPASGAVVSAGDAAVPLVVVALDAPVAVPTLRAGAVG